MPTKRSRRTSATTVPSAAKLKKLQDSLNKNKRLRSAFIQDPGAVLRERGLEIGADKERKISRYLAELSAPQRSAFEAQIVRIRIGVRVRVRIRVNIGITL
jgi:hypothetical protein